MLDALHATPNATATPPIAGDWTLAQVKSFKEHQDKIEQALHKLRAKCGNDWTLDIDWASFSTHTKTSSYRNELGKYVNESLILAFANNDVEKFDGDVAEALNGAVGTAKKIKFSSKFERILLETCNLCVCCSLSHSGPERRPVRSLESSSDHGRQDERRSAAGRELLLWLVFFAKKRFANSVKKTICLVFCAN